MLGHTMNEINIQASVHNLSQLDRHQQDVHRTPVENQAQNTETNRDELAHRAQAADEPEQTEGKNINPNNKGGNTPYQKRKRRKIKEKRKRRNPSNSGRFIDVDA